MQDVEMLYSAESIRNRIKALTGEILRSHAGDEIVLIGLLNGCFMFISDLARALSATPIRISVDFMKVSSYGDSQQSSGEVRVLQDIHLSIHGRPVLVVDDILDSGHSLSTALRILRTHAPKSLRTCVLLDKSGRRQVEIRPDFTGFEAPNRFVVGYGLDYAEQYRALPYIGALKS